MHGRIKRIKVFQTKWQFVDFVVLWWKPLPPKNMFSLLRQVVFFVRQGPRVGLFQNKIFLKRS